MALFAVTAAPFVGVPSAEGQTVPFVQMSVDSGTYGPGETIHVSGLVHRENGGAVAIRVMSPNGAVVAVGQVIPDGRDWSWSLPAEFDLPGTYTIIAHYSLTGDAERRAAASFVFTMAEEGAVLVNGTMHGISYTGDPVLSAYTDPSEGLIYLEFDGPSAGVMRLSEGLHGGGLLAVDGGMLTPLPDGSHAYSTDSGMLVLAADSVAVPEFGMAAALALAAGAAAPALLRRRLQ